MIQSMDLSKLANTLDHTMKFSPKEWRWLASRYGFKLTDLNTKRRRFGKYGKPDSRWGIRWQRRPRKADVIEGSTENQNEWEGMGETGYSDDTGVADALRSIEVADPVLNNGSWSEIDARETQLPEPENAADKGTRPEKGIPSNTFPNASDK